MNGQSRSMTPLTGSEITTLTGFQTAAPVYSVLPSPAGKYVVWYARASFQIQETATGRMYEAVHMIDFINSIMFSPDGSKLILSAGDKLLVYDVRSGSLLSQVTLVEPFRCMDVSPDSQMVGIGLQQGLQFLDLATFNPHFDHPTPC